MKTAYIFTSSTCGACKKLKILLDKNPVPYIEIDRDLPEHKNLWNEISQQLDSPRIPLLFIQDDNSGIGTAYLSREDWKSHEELIEIIKNNI